jgi:hypothetical protein
MQFALAENLAPVPIYSASPLQGTEQARPVEELFISSRNTAYCEEILRFI